jgi:hypothetical protein
VGAGGFKVDVVGAGGGDQDQLELRAGGQGGVEQDFIADDDAGALQAFDDVVWRGVCMQLQLAEACAGAEVKVAEVQRRVIKEDGAASVRHQLYLLCCE